MVRSGDFNTLATNPAAGYTATSLDPAEQGTQQSLSTLTHICDPTRPVQLDASHALLLFSAKILGVAP